MILIANSFSYEVYYDALICYLAESRVDIENLVLRYFVSHFSSNSGGVAYWLVELTPRFASTPERRN